MRCSFWLGDHPSAETSWQLEGGGNPEQISMFWLFVLSKSDLSERITVELGMSIQEETREESAHQPISVVPVSGVYTCCLSVASHTSSLSNPNLLREWYLLKLGSKDHDGMCHITNPFLEGYLRSISPMQYITNAQKMFFFLRSFSCDCKTRNGYLFSAFELNQLRTFQPLFIV